jgi:hypothetical protein
MSDTPAHSQRFSHTYWVHYPEHGPRSGDPHYVDFEAYHHRTRDTARCYVGQRIGFDYCADAKGQPCPPPPEGGIQPGLELHHTHIEFAVQNGVDLKALEVDYPGVSDPDAIGAWVESAANLRWLCVAHHRSNRGAHAVDHSNYEGSQYIPGLVTTEKE